jgi:ubiquinone/menaquinone biosynthesis C-methylase UbiE
MYSEQADFEQHDAEITDFFETCRRLNVSIPRGGMGLDVGGGQGMHVWRFLELCQKLVVADIVNYPALYEGRFLQLLAEKHARNNRAFDLSKVVFVESDAQSQIFRDGLFDIVVSFNALEHVPDPGAAFREVLRVAKPGALVFLQFDPIWTSPAGNHFSHFVEEPWAHLKYSTEEFGLKMRVAGATDDDVSEFCRAMNRVRLQCFLDIFHSGQMQGLVEIVDLETWPTTVEEEPRTAHPNFGTLLTEGYSPAELITRGIRLCGIRSGKSVVHAHDATMS